YKGIVGTDRKGRRIRGWDEAHLCGPVRVSHIDDVYPEVRAEIGITVYDLNLLDQWSTDRRATEHGWCRREADIDHEKLVTEADVEQIARGKHSAKCSGEHFIRQAWLRPAAVIVLHRIDIRGRQRQGGKQEESDETRSR